MDGFSFVDIFATKGIEYLVVTAYLIVFTFFVKTLISDNVKTGNQPGGNSHNATHDND